MSTGASTDRPSLEANEEAGSTGSFSMQLNEVFTDFIGLGNNCEFGIVRDVALQGTASTGLFHAVGFLDTQQMINAINAGLQGMFDEGRYSFVSPIGWPDYAIDCLQYGFRFHTGVELKHSARDDALEKALTIMRFRKRIFLEELALGAKIFVYRHNAPFDDEAARKLFGAIRRHGPGRLLFIRQDPTQHFGSVEEHADGLYYGAISRLSNENPPVIDFAAWEKIARTILNEPSRVEKACPTLPEEYVDVGVHAHHQHSDRPMVLLTTEAVSGAFYQFDALVYLPSSFSSNKVSLTFVGWPSESWTSADLNARDVWQRISVTAQAPAHHSLLVLALTTSKESSGHLYTADCNLRRLEND